MSPAQAEEAKERILASAADAGRTFNSEHFGMTIAYARGPQDLDQTGALPESPAAVGGEALRVVVKDLTAVGLCKFSLRRVAPVDSWENELAWLADAVLDLET